MKKRRTIVNLCCFNFDFHSQNICRDLYSSSTVCHILRKQFSEVNGYLPAPQVSTRHFFLGSLSPFYGKEARTLSNESGCNHPTFSRIGNYGFAILKYENTVWAEFDAAWFSSLDAAIAFVRIDYRKPRAI